MINLDPEVKVMQVKSISAKLCSAVAGQVSLCLLLSPCMSCTFTLKKSVFLSVCLTL